MDASIGSRRRGLSERRPEIEKSRGPGGSRDRRLQPVLVAPDGDGSYRLVAGEGRYLAAAEAGCTEIPALVRDTDERTGGRELALAENLAREDLDPVEQAHGFQRLKGAGRAAAIKRGGGGFGR